MSSPVIPSGGGGTVNRKWVPEVNMGTVLAPTWTPIGFVNNVSPSWDNPSMQDSTTFGDGGFSSQDKTGTAWSCGITVMRKIPDSAPTTYDAAQEFIRTKSIGVLGAANRLQFRFYEFDTNDVAGVLSPRTEAYMGFAQVQWAEQGGAYDAESSVVLTLTGAGKLNQISHPYPLTPSVPVINSVTPRNVSTAGGAEIVISGQHFTGTTAITVGGTNVTSFTVLSDSTIVATVPAKTAGAQPLVVTNATGASTTGGSLTYA